MQVGVTIAVLAMLLLSHEWIHTKLNLLHIFNQRHVHDHKTMKHHNTIIRETVYPRITKWRHDQLRAIDSSRIFMHEIAGLCEIDAKKSCAAESAAKHNPNRLVQLFARLPLNISMVDKKVIPFEACSPLLAVLQYYPNLELIWYNDAEYFNNTPLDNWFKYGNWQQSSNMIRHLSDYSSMLSLFRGGGLFVDLENVLMIKPLFGSKWWNFFVRNSMKRKQESQNLIRSDIMHLVYGHHLSDKIIVNLLQGIYGSWESAQSILAGDAIEAMMTTVCGGIMDTNKCVDIHFFDHQDSFLPQFESSFWNPVILALTTSKTSGRVEEDEVVRAVLKKTIDSHDAPFFAWETMTQKQMKKEEPSRNLLNKVLLSMNCPRLFEYLSGKI